MKLSVAMITYNHERYIGQAIESVLCQKVNFEYEIVIGEDRSTDGTRAIVQDCQRRYPDRIFPLFREGNVGAMQNFAETIAACRGEYVAFLEGDDYWTSADKVQRQVDFLDAHPDCAIACHRVLYLDEAAAEKHDLRSDVRPRRPPGTYTLEDLLRDNFVMTCSTVLKRDLLGPFPGWLFDMKMGDWPLFAIVASHGKIALMDETMATYRVHPGGIWSSLPRATQLQEVVRMLTALDKELGYRHTKAIRGTVTSTYLDLANAARFSGSRMETARYLFNYARNGGLRLPLNRFVAGLAAYTLIGSGYRVFSRAKPANGS
jgi:glycosyltransferase involved in cell wall biosynthesis